MVKKNNSNITIKITHKMELLFWLMVIFIVVLFSVSFYMKHEKVDNDYNIYMSDVDGLIVGSPVRIMGIDVGHVKSIKPTNEEVFVKFIIRDKNIVIPQGTIATVEFSGMAGSKSLELYLPNNSSEINITTPILTVNPPKRLHDAMGLLNEMFDKLGAIMSTSSIFGHKLKQIDIPAPSNASDLKDFILYADSIVDDSNKKVDDFAENIKKIYNLDKRSR